MARGWLQRRAQAVFDAVGPVADSTDSGSVVVRGLGEGEARVEASRLEREGLVPAGTSVQAVHLDGEWVVKRYVLPRERSSIWDFLPNIP